MRDAAAMAETLVEYVHVTKTLRASPALGRPAHPTVTTMATAATGFVCARTAMKARIVVSWLTQLYRTNASNTVRPTVSRHALWYGKLRRATGLRRLTTAIRSVPSRA